MIEMQLIKIGSDNSQFAIIAIKTRFFLHSNAYNIFTYLFYPTE